MYQEKRLILTVKNPNDIAAKAAIKAICQIGVSQEFLIMNYQRFVNGKYGSPAHMRLEQEWEEHIALLEKAVMELASSSGADIELSKKLFAGGHSFPHDQTMFVFNADYSNPGSLSSALSQTIRTANADIVPCGWETDVVIGELMLEGILDRLKSNGDKITVIEVDSSRCQTLEEVHSSDIPVIKSGDKDLFKVCMEQLTFAEKFTDKDSWVGKVGSISF